MRDNKFRFPVSERLKKSDVLTQLVSSGRSELSHPLRCTYRIIDHDGESNVKAAFTVSKKNFKSAVKRNKIKRQMREAFRLNKNELIEKMAANNKTCQLLFIFIEKQETEYMIIEKAMIKHIQKIGRA